ncbi:MFS transporter [Allokutzneria sp. A3M-2-11 16]|uniref:MFS transporter n=1 Tax=Allokutzneria sp. A3M-2-11 16 TaxID=2962043 RepID=UPI0020B7C5F7|nr:MFS transporter [Allokutzneria sp. A3M-2-11 16]MCP3803103.1 MFS transporter [Allokutzneria sp. A3M-2-11 16]
MFTVPGARGFVAAGLLGRFPMSMLGLSVVLMVTARGGSFSMAGGVVAALLVGQAITAPWIGRLADRLGQGRVLRVCVAVHVLGLLGILASGTWWTAVLSGFCAGIAFPPIGSMVRARWVSAVGGTNMLETAFSVEAVSDELVFVFGPLITVALCTLVSPEAGLLCVLVFTVIGGIGLAAQRSTEPATTTAKPEPVITRDGMRALVLACLALGTIVSSLELALVAVATERGGPFAVGALVALLAAGSLVSGVLYGILGWQAPVHRRFVIAVAAMFVGVLPMPLLNGLTVLGVLVFFVGFTLSPALIACYQLVELMVPARALTEGFAWLQTALGAGMAIGAAVTGQIVDLAGGQRAFLVPVLAGVAATAAVGLAYGALGRCSEERHVEQP